MVLLLVHNQCHVKFLYDWPNVHVHVRLTGYVDFKVIVSTEYMYMYMYMCTMYMYIHVPLSS